MTYTANTAIHVITQGTKSPINIDSYDSTIVLKQDEWRIALTLSAEHLYKLANECRAMAEQVEAAL